MNLFLFNIFLYLHTFYMDLRQDLLQPVLELAFLKIQSKLIWPALLLFILPFLQQQPQCHLLQLDY